MKVMFFLLFIVAFFCSVYAYDVKTALSYEPVKEVDWKVVSREIVDGIEVQEITYASPVSGRVPSYLVKPSGKGSFAGIVYQHWGQGDKTEFIYEAIQLAKVGAISLLVDAPFFRPKEWRKDGGFSKPEEDLDSMAQALLDWRRGFDLLIQQNADPNRLGFVGHSYGATLGGTLAGTENRLKTAVLIAGYPALSKAWNTAKHPPLDDYVKSLTAEQLKRYSDTVSELDSNRFVAMSKASFLFQFAKFDIYISREHAEEYFAAVQSKKDVRWYNTSHDLNDPAALEDRIQWLSAELGLARTSATLSADGFNDLMQTLADGWNEGNSRKAADCFTEDAIYSEPPDKQLYKGKEELFKFFGGGEGRKNQMKMTWHHLIYDEKSGLGSGEFTFEYGGSVHGMVIVRTQGGKIKNWREYWYESPLSWEKFTAQNPF